MNAQLSTVQFHEQSITVLKHNDQPYVAMRPIAENIGLDWDAQRQRIKRHNVLSEGAVIITAPSKGGKQDYLCLPLSMLNGWLFGIEVNRVKPEIRPTLIQYQFECFDVLYKHFMPKAAEQYPSSKPSTVSDRTPLKNTVNWAVHKTGLSHSDVYTMVHNYFGVESVSDLTDEQIPQAVKYLCEVVTTPANQPTLTEILPSTRYLLTKAHNGLGYLLQPIAPDANMVNDNDIAFHIENNMPRLSVEALASIITVCTKRMQRRMEWSEMRIKSLKKDNPQLGFFA